MVNKDKDNFFLIFITNYLKPIVFLITIASLVCLMLFLYQNVYKTIISAEEIAILKQKVTIETINKTKIDQVVQKIEDKVSSTSTDDQVQIKNPFFSEAPDKK